MVFVGIKNKIMRVGTIKVDHPFKVVFSGIHSLIFHFETALDCRNAMEALAWYCDKDKAFFITSINEILLEVVYTKSTLNYHNGDVWID